MRFVFRPFPWMGEGGAHALKVGKGGEGANQVPTLIGAHLLHKLHLLQRSNNIVT